MVFDGGQVTNASFADYKIPGILDIPPMEIELVVAEQTTGPFGAKGVGETGTFGVSPAIANAIERCGRRAADQPAADAPRRCCARCAEKEGRPLGAGPHA